MSKRNFSRWIKFYAEAKDDPKIVMLSDKDYRCWTIMLLVAGQDRAKQGNLPRLAEMAIHWRCSVQDATAIWDRLVSSDLIEFHSLTPGRPGGARPRNWDSRQYVADSSTERMRKLRLKRKISKQKTT